MTQKRTTEAVNFLTNGFQIIDTSGVFNANGGIYLHGFASEHLARQL